LELSVNYGVPRPQISCIAGQSLLELGRTAEAATAFAQASEHPLTEFPVGRALSAHGYAAGRLGDDLTARSDFAKAAELDPDNPWLHFFHALADGRAGHRDVGAGPVLPLPAERLTQLTHRLKE
jgi:hypothetical protein